MTKNIINIIVLSIFMLISTSAAAVEDAHVENKIIPVGSAESVEIDIEMGVGELTLQGGAIKTLLNANFTYKPLEWKPQVKYSITNKKGHLNITQPNIENLSTEDHYHGWDLTLKNDLPFDLEMDFGVGECNLDLSGLQLSELDLNLGTGEMTVDLSGDWQNSFTTEINGGVGDITLILPKSVGARVKIDKGLADVHAEDMKRLGNTFVNETYGTSNITLEIELDIGIGSITLNVEE